MLGVCLDLVGSVEARCFHSNWVKLVTVWHTPLRLGSYEDPLGSEVSNEKKHGLFRVYRGLYYPVIWGLL